MPSNQECPFASGWHIYWINPGAAGEPPECDIVADRRWHLVPFGA